MVASYIQKIRVKFFSSTWCNFPSVVRTIHLSDTILTTSTMVYTPVMTVAHLIPVLNQGET